MTVHQSSADFNPSIGDVVEYMDFAGEYEVICVGQKEIQMIRPDGCSMTAAAKDGVLCGSLWRRKGRSTVPWILVKPDDIIECAVPTRATDGSVVDKGVFKILRTIDQPPDTIDVVRLPLEPGENRNITLQAPGTRDRRLLAAYWRILPPEAREAPPSRRKTSPNTRLRPSRRRLNKGLRSLRQPWG